MPKNPAVQMPKKDRWGTKNYVKKFSSHDDCGEKESRTPQTSRKSETSYDPQYLRSQAFLFRHKKAHYEEHLQITYISVFFVPFLC